MKKFNEKNFKAIYSKASDKVFIAYGSKRVMAVRNIAATYDADKLNGMQLAEAAFIDNKSAATDIVKDFLGY